MGGYLPAIRVGRAACINLHRHGAQRRPLQIFRRAALIQATATKADRLHHKFSNTDTNYKTVFPLD